MHYPINHRALSVILRASMPLMPLTMLGQVLAYCMLLTGAQGAETAFSRPAGGSRFSPLSTSPLVSSSRSLENIIFNFWTSNFILKPTKYLVFYSSRQHTATLGALLFLLDGSYLSMPRLRTEETDSADVMYHAAQTCSCKAPVPQLLQT